MTLAMELRDVRVRYGPLEALHGVRLPVPAGALTVLLGRNGSGRTSVLRALAGTVLPASGSVLLHGRDVSRLQAQKRARLGVCFVPDVGAVHGSLTVRENLELASAGGDFDRALDGFPALRPLLGRTAGTLSGGEQRMLAVSRALLTPAGVVLLDEPAQKHGTRGGRPRPPAAEGARRRGRRRGAAPPPGTDAGARGPGGRARTAPRLRRVQRRAGRARPGRVRPAGRLRSAVTAKAYGTT
ncbi:ABC transporter ATP-binding protein [Streptomyces pristinaespiralis ATCC 25486]|uniref:ABC transporter ATP-binding protein n=1 Tax=Streptomyces pristinaespiralis (strain ATCC 25486 / DSM 40338 / CBS 914.69 / JCM 4507 / KCC S-0507 / NBRC 13074 / NRRL 2958 / 5647) TaxID=457429 RepID=D6X9Q6_STRE2|nr:ABC transporter ATP-binding protein [Streptomyces pristinaespiralis ATCC 25486]